MLIYNSRTAPRRPSMTYYPALPRFRQICRDPKSSPASSNYRYTISYNTLLPSLFSLSQQCPNLPTVLHSHPMAPPSTHSQIRSLMTQRTPSSTSSSKASRFDSKTQASSSLKRKWRKVLSDRKVNHELLLREQWSIEKMHNALGMVNFV